MRGARALLRSGTFAVLAVVLGACSGTASTSIRSATTAPTSTVSTSTATSAPSPRHTVKPATVTVAVTGDVLPHASVLRDAAADANGHGYQFRSMIAPVASVVSSADVAICQLETTLSQTDTGLTTANSFVSPHELARDLVAVGFDGCSSANNHSFDAGLAGVISTRKVARLHHLRLAGPAASATTPGQPALYPGPLEVAQLSYSYSVDNAIEQDTSRPPANAPWMRANLYPARQPSGIIADARRARASGADVVIVSMHWGNMFDPMPTAEQRRYAKALLTSGQVDAIIGAHPHVIQPCQQIDGRYVLYSVGNFLSAQGPAAGLPQASEDGVIATLTFRRDARGRLHQSLSYLPTYVGPGHVVHRAVAGTASYRRTVQAMSAMGAQCRADAM